MMNIKNIALFTRNEIYPNILAQNSHQNYFVRE